jgi:hypothetical protein
MNYKLNSYLSILAIACAVAVPLLSANAHELPVQAALSAPASWDIKYAHDGFEFGITNPSNNTSNNYLSYPEYTRTADGIYYNYNVEIDSNDTSIIPQGLIITHTFNRSNTSWMIGSGSTYQAVDTKIGSDSTVGSVSNKFSFAFNNQTNKDYKLFFDMSSTSGGRQLNYQINTQTIITWSSSIIWVDPAHMFNLYIPSYSTVIVGAQPTNTSSSYYFDGWYLKDLGVSAAYDAGYEQGDIDGYEDGLGNNPNVLLSGFQAMVGILVNFMLMIVNLEVFGVSILSVFSILALFVGIIWILKIIRG